MGYSTFITAQVSALRSSVVSSPRRFRVMGSSTALSALGGGSGLLSTHVSVQ